MKKDILNIRHALRAAVVLLLLGASLLADAQQDAQYTQYQFNTMAINPGYAGYRNRKDFTLASRVQWIGFKGAPMTHTLSFNSPLSVSNLSAGGTLRYDKIGPTTLTELSGDLAYQVTFRNRATLSFGAKATFGLYQDRLSDVFLIDEQDATYSFNNSGILSPNIGFGAFYYKSKFFLGLSVPQMLKNAYKERGNPNYELLSGTQEPTAYLMGGKLIKIDRYTKLQPTFLIRATPNAPLSVAGHCNLLIDNRIKIGVFYSYNEVAGALCQVEVRDGLTIGYSVDVAASRLISTNFGSHEIMINYGLKSKKRRIVYPRYF